MISEAKFTKTKKRIHSSGNAWGSYNLKHEKQRNKQTQMTLQMKRAEQHLLLFWQKCFLENWLVFLSLVVKWKISVEIICSGMLSMWHSRKRFHYIGHLGLFLVSHKMHFPLTCVFCHTKHRKCRNVFPSKQMETLDQNVEAMTICKANAHHTLLCHGKQVTNVRITMKCLNSPFCLCFWNN